TNRYINPSDFRKHLQTNYVGYNGGAVILNREAVLLTGKLYPELKWHTDWLLYFVIGFRHGLYYTNSVFVNVTIRKNGYCQGRHNWKEQRGVLQAALQLIHTQFTDLEQDFKSAALLPHYAAY